MLADLERVARVLRMMVECRMEGRVVLEVGELESSILDRKDLCHVSGDGCVGARDCLTVCCKSRVIYYTVSADDSATAI
jgi:hypothetical protein